ncbi:hypothetical protein C8J57DRAFT_1535591 [Mycena rebaudengoi]|nr:hypothetical protein C8J57DRAFT_1535591 [Mycena rebaudengoi]
MRLTGCDASHALLSFWVTRGASVSALAALSLCQLSNLSPSSLSRVSPTFPFDSIRRSSSSSSRPAFASILLPPHIPCAAYLSPSRPYTLASRPQTLTSALDVALRRSRREGARAAHGKEECVRSPFVVLLFLPLSSSSFGGFGTSIEWTDPHLDPFLAALAPLPSRALHSPFSSFLYLGSSPDMAPRRGVRPPRHVALYIFVLPPSSRCARDVAGTTLRKARAPGNIRLRQRRGQRQWHTIPLAGDVPFFSKVAFPHTSRGDSILLSLSRLGFPRASVECFRPLCIYAPGGR